MLSLFAGYMADVRRAVDSVFGEEVTIVPQDTSNPYVLAGESVSAPSFTATGVVRISGSALRVAGTGYKAKQDASMVGTRSEISFNAAQFGFERPIPQTGWLIKLTSRDIPVTFRISFPREDAAGRIHCSVERIDKDGSA